MKKVRDLLFSNVLDLGREKSLVVHCKYFDKEKFQVFVCGRLKGGVRVPEFKKYNIPVFVNPSSIDELSLIHI